MNQSSKTSMPSSADRPEPIRRGFLAGFAAVLAGAPLVLGPIGAALAMFLDPLVRRKTKGDQWIQVGKAGSVPDNGDPALFQVVAARQDAWTSHSPQAIGAVYVRKNQEGKLVALSAECPHLGCFIPFDGKRFACPCHASTFQVDGARLNVAECASPRDMDPLKVDESKLTRGEIWVEFKKFRAGQAERVEKA